MRSGSWWIILRVRDGWWLWRRYLACALLAWEDCRSMMDRVCVYVWGRSRGSSRSLGGFGGRILSEGSGIAGFFACGDLVGQELGQEWDDRGARAYCPYEGEVSIWLLVIECSNWRTFTGLMARAEAICAGVKNVSKKVYRILTTGDVSGRVVLERMFFSQATRERYIGLSLHITYTPEN